MAVKQNCPSFTVLILQHGSTCPHQTASSEYISNRN